ncbi:divalent cation transporter [Peptostreptococcus sp. MV1]|uniref:magnesium transporter n=1 Tax=Peptostreptococcus sp. MV1 TaxID=1219626 RepID=UPI0005104BC1|nr:magnesium transporter [Peptostreptococcus sp. MV1]KGF15499.1 divalent cation transporter [Peptostreptococcus sp. MV1]
MDKKQDSSRELYNEVKEMIDKSKLIELKETLEEYHTVDIYDVLMELDEVDRVKLFEILPLDIAASILEECELDLFVELISEMEIDHVRSIFEEMSLGDLADILREMGEEEREKILDMVSKEDETELRELLAYVDETSGSTMKKGYVTVNNNLNVHAAIKHIRAEAVDADSIYYIYVLNDEQKLVGVLSLRELFLAKDSEIIEEIMMENVKSVNDNDDREEAVKIVSKYNLVAVPVVDDEGILKGIITIDDIIDVMEEEASEDLYKIAGSSERERDTDEDDNSTLSQQIISCVSCRIGWLILTALISFIAAIIFMNFKKVIDKNLVELLFLAPLVVAMGGSVSSQSSSVTIINLTDKDKGIDKVLILKEIISSLINGVVIAIIAVALLAIFIGKPEITMVVALTVLINMVLGACAGTLLPIILTKMDSDPAAIFSPIMAVLMDVVGIVVYYIMITLFLI